MQRQPLSASAITGLLGFAALSWSLAQPTAAQVRPIDQASELTFEDEYTSPQLATTELIELTPPSSDSASAFRLAARQPTEPSVVGTPALPLADFIQDGEQISADDVLIPEQNRELSTRILVADLSMEGIGGGVLPPGATSPAMEQTLPLPTGLDRAAPFKCVHWQPSLIWHYPLYFEDAMLERHGHVRFGPLQSLAAGAKFYGTLPLLPYLATLQPKHQCRYALGHYRAGSCAPLLRDHLPYDRQAAVVEALSLASLFWAAPL